MKPTIFSSQNTIRYNEKSKFEEKILIFEILRKNLKSIPKLGHVTLYKRKAQSTLEHREE